MIDAFLVPSHEEITGRIPLGRCSGSFGQIDITMLVLSRFSTLFTATFFYLYMKIRSAFKRRARTSTRTVPNDVEAGKDEHSSSIEFRPGEIRGDYAESKEMMSPSLHYQDSTPLPSPTFAFPQYHVPFRSTLSPQPPTPPKSTILGTITNTHGQGIDQARIRSPRTRRSIKRVQATQNLRFESHISAPEGEETLLLLPSTPTIESPSPGSAGWCAEKRRVLEETRRWSVGLQEREKERKRMSLPVLDPKPKAKENSSWRRLHRVVAVSNAVLDTEKPPRLSLTISDVVDIYSGLGLQFIVGDDSADEIDLTLVAEDGETSLLSEQTLPLEATLVKQDPQLASLSLSQESDCDSELAYLQPSASSSLSSSSSSCVSSVAHTHTLPFTLSMPMTTERQSDGTLADVLDALEEMLESPKWMTLVDLEGAVAKREKEQDFSLSGPESYALSIYVHSSV
ncbi:hypothetical protein C8F01DRAFT_1141739 [Mycena amicta]|nr:hypothetical protein C8F01DRAFT_1141739 [Mycena amicta]